MTQQISMEDAFPTFQKRCRELFEANLLLEVKITILERQLAEARGEASPPQPATPEPAPTGGPDLAAVPPYPADEPA